MKSSSHIVKHSKFLSLILRHRPKLIGIELGAEGWVEVDDLLSKIEASGRKMSRELLNEVVEKNNKKRFAFSEDGKRIRASQGHSVTIELGYEPIEPPELLFHGTAVHNLPAIRKTGLIKRKRHHVHLSKEETTATQVGGRHGTPVILIVKSGEMHQAGHAFFCSENGVWLTEAVPPQFIEFPDD